MCTQPIIIYNNQRFVSPDAMDVFRKCPCGVCVACQHQKETEYFLRSYYEFLDCIYAYWDHLTYDDHRIPTKFGRYCFSRKHVQNFIKRLRKAIYLCYGINEDAFRYFVASEYGDDFHRVHYHIVFYVHNDLLDPEGLQDLITYCWEHGTTGNQRRINDGEKQVSDFVISSPAALAYVAKYIYKDDDFTRKNIEFVIAEICSNNIYPPDFLTLHHHNKRNFSYITCNRNFRFHVPNLKYCSLDDYAPVVDRVAASYNISKRKGNDKVIENIYTCRINRHVLKRYFQPFHLQSNGFGLGVIFSDGLDLENETAILPTDLNPKKAVDLPLYIRRKLFYHYEDIDGRIMWFPNDEYLPKLYENELNAIDHDTFQLTNRIKSLDALCSVDDILRNSHIIDYLGIEPPQSIIKAVFDVLGKRSVRDLAIYSRYYRGRWSARPESVCEIISKRLDKRLVDVVDNPLVADDPAVRRFNLAVAKDFAISSADDSAFKGFDAILDLVDDVFRSYSTYAIISDRNDRRQKKKMKQLKKFY